jgi:hypothetical protein
LVRLGVLDGVGHDVEENLFIDAPITTKVILCHKTVELRYQIFVDEVLGNFNHEFFG